MHAPVGTREVAHVTENPRLPDHEGIEEPDLDIRVGIERGQRRIQPDGVVVIQQQANAHAPVGGGAQTIEQQGARHVPVPDVVLDVECTVRSPDQQCPRSKRIARVGQQVDTRIAGIGRHPWRQRLAQARRAGVGRRHGPAAAFEGGQGAATAGKGQAKTNQRDKAGRPHGSAQRPATQGRLIAVPFHPKSIR